MWSKKGSEPIPSIRVSLLWFKGKKLSLLTLLKEWLVLLKLLVRVWEQLQLYQAVVNESRPQPLCLSAEPKTFNPMNSFSSWQRPQDLVSMDGKRHQVLVIMLVILSARKINFMRFMVHITSLELKKEPVLIVNWRLLAQINLKLKN